MAQLKNSGGLLTNSSQFRADAESVSVGVSVTRERTHSSTRTSTRATTHATPVTTHRPVSFTVRYVPDKNTERDRDSGGSTAEATGIATVTQPSVRGRTVTQPSVRGRTVTQPSVRGRTVTQPYVRGRTVTQPSVRGRTVTQPSVRGRTVTQLSVRGRTVTQPSVRGRTVTQPSVFDRVTQRLPESEPATHTVSSREWTTQQPPKHDNRTSGERTTRQPFVRERTAQVTTDNSLGPQHTTNEANTDTDTPVTATESRSVHTSTGSTASVTFMESISVNTYSTSDAPVGSSVTVSPSTQPPTEHSTTSTHWRMFTVIYNRHENNPTTTSQSNERTLTSAGDTGDSWTSIAPETKEGFDTTPKSDDTTTQGHATTMDDTSTSNDGSDSALDASSTATIDSRISTGKTRAYTTNNVI